MYNSRCSAALDQPGLSNVLYDCSVDKLVLSHHLNQVHSLLSEVLQAPWDVNSLREMQLVIQHSGKPREASLKHRQLERTISFEVENNTVKSHKTAEINMSF